MPCFQLLLRSLTTGACLLQMPYPGAAPPAPPAPCGTYKTKDSCPSPRCAFTGGRCEVTPFPPPGWHPMPGRNGTECLPRQYLWQGTSEPAACIERCKHHDCPLHLGGPAVISARVAVRQALRTSTATLPRLNSTHRRDRAAATATLWLETARGSTAGTTRIAHFQSRVACRRRMRRRALRPSPNLTMRGTRSCRITTARSVSPDRTLLSCRVVHTR
eukprot:COSAG04_NODE_360_length_15920_cov_50.432815_9_plen_217_part_00